MPLLCLKDRRVRFAVVIACFASFLMQPFYANAAAPDAGNVSRETNKTLPALPAPPAEETDQKHEKHGVAEFSGNQFPSAHALSLPIEKIELHTPLLRDEINDVLVKAIVNEHATRASLAAARQNIWVLGTRNYRLLHTSFTIRSAPDNATTAILIVDVIEIAVRRISVTSEGDISQDLVASIRGRAEREFPSGTSLDLAELDTALKDRMRLGDVQLHVSVEPVDAAHVDLKFTAGTSSALPVAGLLRYDNDGGWSFGRDRAIAGLSYRGFLPGDQLDLLGMKTMDIGNGDFRNGMFYGRAEYQFPISAWGIKSDTWISGLHYHEIHTVPSNSYANGEALEAGQGVIVPAYTGEASTLDFHADYHMKYDIDRTLETERLDEKTEYAGRAGLAFAQGLLGQVALINLDVSAGDMDLAGDSQSLQQDRAGPRVNGTFAKIEGDGTLSGPVLDSGADYRLNTRGQWAANNLDSIEQFSLGGSTGLRAFGAGEGSGDSGYSVSGDLGYTFAYGLHPFLLYDMGQIWKSARPWFGEGDNLSYVLQDAGAGLSDSLGPIDMSVVFAHQIGPNPGLTTQGLDVDNSSQHYRVWASVSYRF